MKPLSLCELILKILTQYKSWTLLSSREHNGARSQGKRWGIWRATGSFLICEIIISTLGTWRVNLAEFLKYSLSHWEVSVQAAVLTQTTGFCSLQKWWCSLGLTSSERKFIDRLHEYGYCCYIVWCGAKEKLMKPLLTMLKSLRFHLWAWYYKIHSSKQVFP